MMEFPEELKQMMEEYRSDPNMREPLKSWLIASRNNYVESIGEFKKFKFLPGQKKKIEEWKGYIELIDKELENAN